MALPRRVIAVTVILLTAALLEIFRSNATAERA
jgi:hypothetical protein